MDALPVELILKILSYSSIPSLSYFQLTSRRHRQIVCANESYLYHNAALQHRFIHSGDATLADVKPSIPRRLQGYINGWRSYCRVQWQIKRGWLGKGPSRAREYFSAGKDVHRIRVDEQRGFLIATHRMGGLTVTDLEQDVILWSLAQHEVSTCAYCEYDHGFLVLDCPRYGHQIWRASWPPGNDHIPPPTTNSPHREMHRAYRQTLRRHGPSSRGHFHPWAYIENLNATSSFRLVFPTLVTSTFVELFLYDVTNARLIQTINNPADATRGWRIDGLEINDKFIIASREIGIRVFSRETGDKVFDFNDQIQVQLLLTTLPRPDVTQNAALAAHLSVVTPLEPSYIPGHFTTVHLSSCGSHLVCMGYGRYGLLLIRNFEQVLAGTLTLQDSALAMTFLDDNLMYLAVDGDRFAIGISRGGHLVVSFSDKLLLHDSIPTNPLPLPHVSISKSPLSQSDAGFDLHTPCVQITKTLLVSSGVREDLSDIPLIAIEVCPNTALD